LRLNQLSNWCQAAVKLVFFVFVFWFATSIVAAGGGHFEAGFDADLAFLPWCVGVMVGGPSLSLGMEILGLERGQSTDSKNADDGALKVSLLVYE
jgi:hypothetical protein